MGTKKIKCARVFVKIYRSEDPEINCYYNFFVKKEEAEKMYIYIQQVCHRENIKCDIIGFGITKKEMKPENLDTKQKIYETITLKEYKEEKKEDNKINNKVEKEKVL